MSVLRSYRSDDFDFVSLMLVKYVQALTIPFNYWEGTHTQHSAQPLSTQTRLNELISGD